MKHPPLLPLHPPLARPSFSRAERTPRPVGRSALGAGPPPRSLRLEPATPPSVSSLMPNLCRQTCKTPRFSSISRLKRTKILANARQDIFSQRPLAFGLIRMNRMPAPQARRFFYPVFFEHSQRATPPSLNTWLRPTPPSLPLCPWPRGDPPFGRSLWRDLRIRDHWQEGSKCLAYDAPVRAGTVSSASSFR